MLRAARRALSSTPAPRVAVVGSGPGGFYTAKYLLRDSKDVQVTILDRWPTPFGLVRYGVAPDHLVAAVAPAARAAPRATPAAAPATSATASSARI